VTRVIGAGELVPVDAVGEVDGMARAARAQRGGALAYPWNPERGWTFGAGCRRRLREPGWSSRKRSSCVVGGDTHDRHRRGRTGIGCSFLAPARRGARGRRQRCGVVDRVRLDPARRRWCRSYWASRRPRGCTRRDPLRSRSACKPGSAQGLGWWCGLCAPVRPWSASPQYLTPGCSSRATTWGGVVALVADDGSAARVIPGPVETTDATADRRRSNSCSAARAARPPSPRRLSHGSGHRCLGTVRPPGRTTSPSARERTGGARAPRRARRCRHAVPRSRRPGALG
jgi:hypothetical protein